MNSIYIIQQNIYKNNFIIYNNIIVKVEITHYFFHFSKKSN